MNVIVTGGAGYLGIELVKNLINNDLVNKVIIYDNLSRLNYSIFVIPDFRSINKIKFVEGDILDSELLKKLLKEVDCVYHLAAKVAVPLTNEDTFQFEQVNHWGSAQLSYAVEHSSHISKLIFTSSTAVYGNHGRVVNIEDSENPTCNYGRSKLHGERMLQRLNNKLDFYSFRLGNLYGFSQGIKYEGVINRFIFDAHFKNRISLIGTGEQSRSFINVKKAGKVLSTIPFEDNVKPGIYDIFDFNYTINDLQGFLTEIYTRLEYVKLGVHLSLPSLTLAYSRRASFLENVSDDDFRKHIEEFKNEFTINYLQ